RARFGGRCGRRRARLRLRGGRGSRVVRIVSLRVGAAGREARPRRLRSRGRGRGCARARAEGAPRSARRAVPGALRRRRGMRGRSVESPALREGFEEIYARSLDCVHCGLCLPACPTYLETGREISSPRGRVYLMRGVAEGRIPLGDVVEEEAFLCLGCR